VAAILAGTPAFVRLFFSLGPIKDVAKRAPSAGTNEDIRLSIGLIFVRSINSMKKEGEHICASLPSTGNGNVRNAPS